jgi:hypothetical protein
MGPGRACAQAVDVTITEYEVWSNLEDNGIVRIRPISGSIVNPAGCADPDSYLTRATMTAQVQARVLAVALAAKATGRALTLRISGCSNDRPAVSAAVIK